MKKLKKPDYSIAMSKDTGCIVMIRTNGKTVTVIGSLTREDSLKFVRDIMEWSELTIETESRLYPH
jgi:hypothetical protein